jgi:outer membrane protein OmpA-like peptidoglycan-associated protein
LMKIQIALAAALVSAIGLVVVLVLHKADDDLARRLKDIDRRLEALGQLAQSTANDVERSIVIASAARAAAADAAQRAGDAAARKGAAEDQAQVAQEAQRSAEEEARRSRLELTEMQQRREQELDRMNQALARIASTRRTDNGLVINLADDSFHFDFDKDTLRQENRELLSRIAGVLLNSNGYRLFVHGHTDDIGSQAYNLQLSERRAANVANYLKSSGVDPNVIETKGFGQSSPRSDGTSGTARAKNRRVEIVLVDSIVHYTEAAPPKGRQ